MEGTGTSTLRILRRRDVSVPFSFLVFPLRPGLESVTRHSYAPLFVPKEHTSPSPSRSEKQLLCFQAPLGWSADLSVTALAMDAPGSGATPTPTVRNVVAAAAGNGTKPDSAPAQALPLGRLSSSSRFELEVSWPSCTILRRCTRYRCIVRTCHSEYCDIERVCTERREKYMFCGVDPKAGPEIMTLVGSAAQWGTGLSPT